MSRSYLSNSRFYVLNQILTHVVQIAVTNHRHLISAI